MTMEEFLFPSIVVILCSAIGAVTTWIFGGSAWIGALVGAGIPTVFFLGFWLAMYLIIVGLAELLIKSGK